MSMIIDWPGGKRFAFTIVDDTDLTTATNGPPVYELLYDLNIITTKSVWPLQGDGVPRIGGATCADPAYLKWVRKLQGQGFEIALHNVAYSSSTRGRVIDGLGKFWAHFGQYPAVHVNHADCRDGIYWGDGRLTGANRLIYNVLTGFRNRGRFKGTAELSDFFWGDKCRQHIAYVRNFVYSNINTLKECPYMPYFDPQRPFVNNWFASSEGANCRSFCRTVSEANQDRLEEERGCCIMYTHLGTDGFQENGRLNPDFRRLMERLSRKQGWFAPVSTVLNHIRKLRGRHVLTDRERSGLERRWLLGKVLNLGR